MQKIKDEIKDRALLAYPEKFKGNVMHHYIDCNSILRGCYKQGAESMLPVMQDVAVKFAYWLNHLSYDDAISIANTESAHRNTEFYYTYFINEVYGKD